MSHYVGLDASKATTNVCILDHRGTCVTEGVVPTDPGAIIAFLRGEGRRYARIGIEPMSFTSWLYEGLSRAGLPFICIEAKYAHAVLQRRLNKTDRNDARGIAEIMRSGQYKAVHLKTRASQEIRLVLSARKLLTLKRTDLDNRIAAALLQFGHRIRPARGAKFIASALQFAVSSPVLSRIVTALAAVRSEIFKQIAELDLEIRRLVASDPVCCRLCTAPGVGPLTALSYRAAIDIPERFGRSRDVAVHLGLTPQTSQSGSVDWRGRISKCGDSSARTLLYLAAWSIFRTRTRTTRLREWGLSIAARRGRGRAVVAVARRLAVILHQMWRSGTDFREELQAT